MMKHRNLFFGLASLAVAYGIFLRGERHLTLPQDSPSGVGKQTEIEAHSNESFAKRQQDWIRHYLDFNAERPPNVHEILSKMRAAKGNVFFSSEALLESVLRSDPAFVGHLTDLLLDAESLNSVSNSQESILSARSPTVLERMNAIDLLESALDINGQTENDAEHALEKIVRSPVLKSWSEKKRRLVVAEKYDAMVSLARHDRRLAADTMEVLDNEHLRSLMLQAFIAGRVDSGLSREAAFQEAQSI